MLTNGGGASIQLFYAPNIRGGPNTVTMTEVAGGGGGIGNPYNQIAIHEYSGIALAWPLDAAAAAAGITTSSFFAITSGTAATSANGDLIFGYGNTISGILSAGSGFTARQNSYGISEDMVQTNAGPVSATATDSANNDNYALLMAAFKPSQGVLNGPVLPAQGNRTINENVLLVVTNTAAEVNASQFSTSTYLFNYTNRDALLADGWIFFATNNGAARNTEITNPAVGAVICTTRLRTRAWCRFPVIRANWVSNRPTTHATVYFEACHPIGRAYGWPFRSRRRWTFSKRIWICMRMITTMCRWDWFTTARWGARLRRWFRRPMMWIIISGLS